MGDAEAGESGKKKLSPEEIERKRREAEEMGTKANMMSKAERAELNKSRKEKAGTRLAKTGQKSKKFEGEGATSKEEKKKKAEQNVKKRVGIARLRCVAQLVLPSEVVLARLRTSLWTCVVDLTVTVLFPCFVSAIPQSTVGDCATESSSRTLHTLFTRSLLASSCGA